MGKRIVINSYGSAGDLNPFLAIARALRVRGHRIVFATDDCSQTAVEAAGLEFQRARRAFSYGVEDAEELAFFNIRDSYDELMAAVRGADLLITHQLALMAPLVVARTGTRWVSVVLSPFTFGSACEGLASIAAQRGGFSPAFLQMYATQFSNMQQISHVYTRAIAPLRWELKLGPGKNILLEDNHSPQLVLALFSSVFAPPQQDWPSQTTITGFVFDDSLTGGTGLPPELARFLNQGTPPVVFTLGSASVFDTGSFRAASIGAANLLGRRAVLLGPTPLGYRFPDNPNLISVDFAPHDQIFSRAAAVVHHGGIGTTAAAMRAGSPMLVVPGLAWDQPDNAARSVGLGVGRVLPLTEYNPFAAAAELSHLLAAPSYADNASRVSRLIRAEDGVGFACDEIEQYLNRRDVN